MTLICAVCREPFETYPSVVARGRRCCSVKCRLAFMSTYSGENSWHWKGGDRRRVCAGCGVVFEVKHRVFETSRRFCSRACYRTNQAPEHRGRWKGGVTLGENRARYARLVTQRRRALKASLAVGPVITGDGWERLCDEFERRCPCCRRSEPDITLTMDHVIPLSKGGAHALSNIQPLCGTCNSSKGVRMIKFFADGTGVEVTDMPAFLASIIDGTTPIEAAVPNPDWVAAEGGSRAR